MIRAELSGAQAPSEVAEQTTLQLANGEYIVRYAGEIADRGRFELGTVVDTLVLHGRSGPNAGRTIPCLFQIRGDRLRICYGLNGVAPTAFATASGDDRYLATYRRA